MSMPLPLVCSWTDTPLGTQADAHGPAMLDICAAASQHVRPRQEATPNVA